jgi:hypothetical protein
VGVQIVNFDRAELNGLRDWNVKTATELHGEPIVASVARATVTHYLAEVGIEIGMRGAKQGLSEGLEPARMFLDLGPEQIGEQVAAHISHELPVYRNLLATALSVAHEIGLNPD